MICDTDPRDDARLKCVHAKRNQSREHSDSDSEADRKFAPSTIPRWPTCYFAIPTADGTLGNRRLRNWNSRSVRIPADADQHSWAIPITIPA